MAQIQYIATDKLMAHPKNPRKELGDLTELAESIKVSGVMQNLTVVQHVGYCPGCSHYVKGTGACRVDAASRPPCPKWESDGSYTVVIGHRRLAAAKLAGLGELPCMVVDMDERQQLATMLTENIQRSDLTVYEQAQGFQMMLDLGDSVGDIAEKTGFSKKTVNQRIKMLELDRDKFIESSARGATIWEYVELEKIKDIERRNEVLDKVGTDNFKYALKQALDRQTTEKKLAPLIEKLSSFATQAESGNGLWYVRGYTTSNSAEDIEVPEDAGEVFYFYTVNGYGGWIQLMKERVATTEDEEAKSQRDANEAARKERSAQLDEIADRAYKLRWEFVKNVAPTTIKKNLPAIVAASAWERMDGYTSFDEEDFLELLGVEQPDSDDDYTPEAERAMVVEAVLAAPERALLYKAYCDFEDCAGKCYFQRHNGTHSQDSSLNYLYDLLEKLGYKMSDEEKALQDGTHELFAEVER